MQAIILAGGFGTRLRPLLGDIPKPMAPIHGRPFLAYLLDHLKLQGITQVVLSVHYHHEQIQNYFQSSYHGISISYALEKEPLGTGGAIKFALNTMDTQEPVFVINGDTFLRVNYRKMYEQHISTSALLTMALHKEKNCERYGAVIIKDNKIIGFQEKGQAGGGYINAGVYLLQSDLFTQFPMPEHFSIEKDFLYTKLNPVAPQAFIVEDYFIDIGMPEDYAKAVMRFQEYLLPVT